MTKNLPALRTLPGYDALKKSRASLKHMIVFSDGDPGPPDIILSPLTYHYDHAARLEVFAQAGQPAARAIALDGLLRAIGAALVP